jgi:NAD(P)H dehydrogenase (quinone)
MSHIHDMFLVVLGHPGPTSFSDVLAHAYADGLRKAGHEVETLTLRELDFDPHLRAGFGDTLPLEPDLVRAQAALRNAKHVAWFFPTWWATPPALVKGFIDRTFLPGFAFKYKGRGLPEMLLRGRSSRVVTTMDSPGFWYTLWHRASLHASFVNATLKFVGFGPVQATTIYSLRDLPTTKRAHWVKRLAQIGERDGARY